MNIHKYKATLPTQRAVQFMVVRLRLMDDAIIFVVDSADVDRMDEARNEIHSLVQDTELHDAVLLVFANKQDMPNALNATEVSKALDMHSIRDREWYVQTSNAITGEGLVEGLEWLHGMVVNK
ncbi:ADP-ribosylation factor family protein [Teladorsagia circumcincta]|uniref:ADP-ribosylation factor 1-like 2 n=1 Tax=Teladorsagia circumcincta TaxID=45464 RepID=A0A2G9U7Z5_TELCI|nr:ADP-ribosylation factor family protein [Teladorsagia circumcincta]